MNYYIGFGCYALLCLIIYIFVLAPWLKLPSLNLLGTQSEFHAVGFGAALAVAFVRRAKGTPSSIGTPKSEKMNELKANSLI